jgi:adenosylcobinamide-GDP ribazoletransferase
VTEARPLRDVGLAITHLTVVPLDVGWPDAGTPDVASHYVWAGFVVGACAYVPLKALELVGVPWHQHASLVAALVLVVWAMATRFLHWDALADTADGWFGDGPERRREIASDTRIGAFGATSVVLVALVEYAALSGVLLGHEILVLVIPAIARLAATAGAWLGRAAKPTGLGAAVARKPCVPGAVSAAVGTALAMLVLEAAYGIPGLVVGVVGLALSLVVPHLVARRFGGVTGDGLGASILIVEVLLMAIAAVVMT